MPTDGGHVDWAIDLPGPEPAAGAVPQAPPEAVAAHDIDLRGIPSPMLLLRVSRAMEPLATGAQLRVLSDVPEARRDLSAYATVCRHKLVAATDIGDALWVYVLEHA